MSTWTNATKNVATFTNQVKHTVSNFFLLKQDSFYLLLETGGKIILQDSYPWTNQTKN